MSIFLKDDQKKQYELAERKDIVNPNLMTGSKDFSGDNWLHLNNVTQKNKYLNFTSAHCTWAWDGISQYKYVNKNEILTFSAYLKFDKPGGSAIFYIQFNDMSDENNMKGATVDNPEKVIPSTTNNWQRVSITFTVTESGGIKPRLEGDGNSPFWIAGLKLERRATATQWCPANEDLVLKSDFDALKSQVDQLAKNQNGG